MYKQVLPSPSTAQNPAPASTLSTIAKAEQNELKCVPLQFGKDVINFRSRTKVIQENSVHFWSEIFLRYRIILGNKTRGSVNGLFLCYLSSSQFCLSLSLSLSLFPPSLLPSFFLSFIGLAKKFIWGFSIRSVGGQGEHSENIYEASGGVHLDTGFEVSKALFSVFSLYFKLKSFLLLKGC